MSDPGNDIHKEERHHVRMLVHSFMTALDTQRFEKSIGLYHGFMSKT